MKIKYKNQVLLWLLVCLGWITFKANGQGVIAVPGYPAVVGGSVQAVVKQGNTVYVGGSFTSFGGATRSNLAAFNQNTGQVTSFAPNVNGIVLGILVNSGTIYIAGQFTSINGVTRNYIAAIDSATGNLTNWNPNADAYATSLALNGTTLYVGGNFQTIGGQSRSRIAGLDLTTGLATTWNPGCNGLVRCIALNTARNALYAGGDFTTYGGQTRNYFGACLLSTNVARTSDPTPNTAVFSLIVTSLGVFIGGGFTTFGGTSRNGLAVLTESTATLTSFDAAITGTSVGIYSLFLSGSQLYLGGTFTKVGGQTSTNLAAINASTGSPVWAANTNGIVSALNVGADYIFAGGYFTQFNTVNQNVFVTISTSNPPTISSFSPATVKVGDTVTISGSDFSNVTAVTFGGNNVPFYTVKSGGIIKAVAGCTGTGNVLVSTYSGSNSKSGLTINPLTASINPGGPNTFCTGGSVTLTATGGTSYLWSDNSTANPRTVTGGGTYSVKAIVNGCTSASSSSVVVTVNTTPTASINQGGPTTFCTGGSVTLTATGGTSYLWSDNSTANPRTVTGGGTYSVQAIANGCTSASSTAVVVTVNTTPTASINPGGPTTFCTGGSVTLTATGGTSYLWSDNSTANPRTVTGGGTYSVQAIANGCTSASSTAVVVTVNTTPTASINQGGPTTFCTGGSVTLTATGGTSYLWSDNSTANPRTVTGGGTYSVQAIANGCTSASSTAVVVTVNSTATPTINPGGPTTFCTGGSVTLTATGGTSYLWSDNSTANPRTVTGGGTYSVQAIANGCTSASSSSVVVTVKNLPTVNVYAGGGTGICVGGSVTLTASGGQSYIWNDGSTANPRTVASAGAYTAQAIQNGCTSGVSTPVVVTAVSAPPRPTLTATGPTSICPGTGSVTLKTPWLGTGTFYNWSDRGYYTTDSSRVITNPGTYTVAVAVLTNGVLCPSPVSNSITVNNVPVTRPNISADGQAFASNGTYSICPGSSATLSLSGTADSYFWQDGSTGNTKFASTEGLYSAFSVLNGCTSITASSVISIKFKTQQATPAIAASGATSFCGTGQATLSHSNPVKALAVYAGQSGTSDWVQGNLTDSRFNSPNYITHDAAGNLYVTDLGYNGIVKISTAGQVSIYAGSGNWDYVDGPAASAAFSVPSGLAFDANGNLFVADNGNNVIRKIDPLGNVSTYAGDPNIYGQADGPLATASFNSPIDLDFDAAGNMYVVDQGSNRIRKITPAGIVSTFAGSGSNYFASRGMVDGPGSSAKFNNPSGITLDAAGNIYVADNGNNAIRKITPAGVVSTFALSGTGSNFGSPNDLAFDAAGNLYITSYSQISQISATGTFTTIADNNSTGVVPNNATGVTTNLQGNVYFTNQNDFTILTLAPKNYNYLWSNGATTASITASTSGTYSLQTIENGCTSQASNAIVVSIGNPVASISASGPLSLCQGSSLTLTALGGTGYIWNDGSTANPRTVSVAGSYSVQAISNGCTSGASAPKVVTVASCGQTWLGTASNDWGTASNWSTGSVPSANADVEIPNTPNAPTFSGNNSIHSLTIDAGATLTLAGKLSLSGNLTNNGTLSGAGTLNLNGTSAQTLSGTAFNIANISLNNASGAVTSTKIGISGVLSLVKGTFTSNGNLTLLSSATGSGYIDDFSAGNTGAVSGTVNVEKYISLSGYNLLAPPVSGQTINALGKPCNQITYWSEANNSTLAAPINCKTAAYPSGTSVFANATAGSKFVFSGNVFTGNLALNLTRGPGTNPQRGFNAVGNPYPSPFYWSNLAAIAGNTANSNLSAWIWNPATLQWGGVTATGITSGGVSNKIEIGQGILVRRSTIGTTGGLTFNNSARVNPGPSRLSGPENVLRLQISGTSGSDEALLLSGTQSMEKIVSPEAVPSLSTGDDLMVNALPTDFTGTVALNITAPASGLYKLAVKELAEVNVTLEDKKTGTFTVLTPETKLDLNLNESNSGRFALHYGSGSTTNQTQIFAADKLVTVIMPTADNAVIEAVNTLGQVVSTISSTERVTRFALPHDGVFVIHVKSSNGVKSGKVIY